MADPIEIQSKVFDMLKAALPDFDCTWGFTKKAPGRKWCYMGDLAWPESDWKTNRSRQHTMTIPIVVNAILIRTTPKDGAAYIMGQLNRLEAAFNADSELRSTGVITWGLAPRMAGVQPHVDGLEAQTVIELSVTYRP